MSLVPEFEIGLWNAWILTLYLPLHPLIMMLIDKVAGTGDMFKKMEAPAYRKAERIINIFSSFVLLFGLFIYSVFLPLQLGTIWFYIGLSLCVLGVIAATIAIVNIANIPLGEPWTKGLYRYSRHPMYLALFLILIGAGIASASWVFLLFSIVLIVLSAILVIAEERFCLEKFGNAYREYMYKTTRWIGIPKSRDWIEGKVNVGEKAGPGGITVSRVVRWVFLLVGLSLIVAFVLIRVLPQWQESGEEPVVPQPPAQLVPTTMWINLYSPASLLDGNPVPAGAVITAYDPGGVLCGKFTVVRPGQYGLMPVYADDPTTTWDEGAAPGETITLRVNGFLAKTGPAETRWTSLGDLLRVDLVASTPPSRPQG